MINKLVYRIAALFIGIAACSQTTMALDINVVHSGSWPPYADENLPEQGLAIDLVTTALPEKKRLQSTGQNSSTRTDSGRQQVGRL